MATNFASTLNTDDKLAVHSFPQLKRLTHDAHNASVSGSIVVVNELKLEWSQCVGENALALLWGAPVLWILPLPPPIYIPGKSEKHVAGVEQL